MTRYYKEKYFPALSACAIVAPATKGVSLSIKEFSSFKALTKEFGPVSENNPLACIAKVLFLNNVSKIYCVAPAINSTPTEENYKIAFNILKKQKDFYSIICDSNEPKIVSELIKSINTNTGAPRLAFVGADDNFNNAQKLSSSICDDRLILAFSKSNLISNKNISASYLTAASLAACISTTPWPAQNLTGSLIIGLETKNIDQLSEKKLYNTGLSSLRYFNNQLEVNKIISSSKSSNNINNLLILDTVRSAVINLIYNIKSSPSFKFLSCRSLLSQIILLLSELKNINLISDFLIPKINITSSINISLSIKPDSLINHEYIDTNIII
ncbi:MAG: hypothetical protein J6C55_01860 [Oscillospiraceae bacterium]|nr:hypothetical protein [Oscillospiraceae bacterium]